MSKSMQYTILIDQHCFLFEDIALSPGELPVASLGREYHNVCHMTCHMTYKFHVKCCFINSFNSLHIF